jgi:hypothetical protein
MNFTLPGASTERSIVFAKDGSQLMNTSHDATIGQVSPI